MVKLKTYSINIKKLSALILMAFLYSSIYSQGNCLIYPEDSGERKACELSYQAIEFPQGSRQSQILFDSAILIGPKYPYAYYQKSVPFFKHGLLNEGVQILNKAIELAPQDYLCYRAYWYFSHESYAACIQDLEFYATLPNKYQTYTPGGDLDMRIILGLSYTRSGSVDKGIETISDCIKSYTADMSYYPYDYYILGALYFQNEQYEEAEIILEKQIEFHSDFANGYYQLGLVKKAQNDFMGAQELFKKALSLLNGEDGGYARNIWGFKVSREDLEREITS